MCMYRCTFAQQSWSDDGVTGSAYLYICIDIYVHVCVCVCACVNV